MKRLAVLANREKKDIETAIQRVKAWADQKGVELVTNLGPDHSATNPDATGPFGTSNPEDLQQKFYGADALLTLGGDGTLLYAAQIVAPLNLPVISVNLGSLGFHAQLELDMMESGLDSFYKGEFRTEPRLLLRAHLENEENSEMIPPRQIALNDIVVNKSAWGHMVHLRLFLDDNLLTDISADGLIIASPTGSSAYNYAAGGPVIAPNVEAVVINAICPHRMYLSPLVVPCTSELRVRFHPRRTLEDAQVLIDGQPWCTVTRQDTLKISRAPMYLPLVIFEDDFYNKLREKLRWGGLF